LYIPSQFEELRADVLYELIRTHPLATLVTYSSNGLNANHIPLYLSEEPMTGRTLRGHIARANPLFSEISKNIEALAIFNGPESYITPSWYATKKETGKVVPTWNYAVVHVSGVLRAIDDESWLEGQLNHLTSQNESVFSEPWAISDAPPDYVKKLLAAIVGIEMTVRDIRGKWKVSQNQPDINQAGVVLGLLGMGQPKSDAMAALVKARVKNVF
jgi:transcriptional regulator